MKPMQIAMALLSAVMFFILAGVFMGVQLELDGTKLVVDTAADIRWQWIFIGTAVVFFFQLLRPLFQKAVKNVSGPKFIMPAIDGSTVKQKLFLIALLVIAVAWPFMVSRGTVDIATLTMIYIILGLGLNVVVGLSGLLVLGYGGFYAIGAYTFALLNHYYGLGFWTCLPLAGLVSAAAGFLLGCRVVGPVHHMAADVGLDPGGKLFDGKGFCNVIVCPALQPKDLVPLFFPRCHHDHRHIALFPQAAQQFEPVHQRQHHIQQYQVHIGLQCQPQALLAVVGLFGLVSLSLEVEGNDIDNGLFILYNQHFCHRLQPPLSPLILLWGQIPPVPGQLPGADRFGILDAPAGHHSFQLFHRQAQHIQELPFVGLLAHELQLVSIV